MNNYISRISVFVLLFGASYNVGIAQSLEQRLSARQHTFDSSVLKETRTYWVSVPDGYDADSAKNNTYPVIYLLDGEKYLPAVMGILDFLTSGNRLLFPKCIVIGIVNTDRTRDFTPTAAISLKGQATLENSGGRPQFAEFLEKELIPDIRKNWEGKRPAYPGRPLVRRFEATFILLQRTASFTDYLLLDPSLWWDDFILLKQGKELVKQFRYLHPTPNVFIGFAGDKAKNPYLRQGQELAGLFQRQPSDQWDIEVKWYPTETHGTIFIPAFYDGLREIFQERE